jgi:hypothetical protein
LVCILLDALRRTDSCFSKTEVQEAIVSVFEALWLLDADDSSAKHEGEGDGVGSAVKCDTAGDDRRHSSSGHTSPTYCDRFVSVVESTVALHNPDVLASSLQHLVLELSRPARASRAFRALFDAALDSLREACCKPIPPLVYWKITDLELPVPCCCACASVNEFLKHPMQSELVVSGIEATWNGHVTQAAEKLAGESSGRLQVVKQCTKVCKVRGRIKIVKVLPESTPLSVMRARPSMEAAKARRLAKKKELERLYSEQPFPKPSVATSLELELEHPVAKKQRMS